MTAKYGVKTEWWKHLRYTKRPHWKSVRKLWNKLINKELSND